MLARLLVWALYPLILLAPACRFRGAGSIGEALALIGPGDKLLFALCDFS